MALEDVLNDFHDDYDEYYTWSEEVDRYLKDLSSDFDKIDSPVAKYDSVTNKFCGIADFIIESDMPDKLKLFLLSASNYARKHLLDKL